MPHFPQGAKDVSTPAAAAQAAKELTGVRELAIDLEADSMHAFRARLCFLQVGTDDDVYLFDTLVPGVDPTLLSPLLQDTQVVKYIHAAGGDLQFLAEAGVRVKGLLDTHRAATLLGWPKVGLADLARELLGITLEKEHQQSDFSLRPLPEGMRDYIAADVRYLCEIGRRVHAACVQADILEEVQLDCDRMCDEAQERPDLSVFRPKLPKAGGAKDQAFMAAAAQALHERRLTWAEEANVPMGRMLSNAALLELVTRPPADLHRMKRVPGVRGPFIREHGEQVLALLKELRAKADAGGLQLEASEKKPRDPKRKKREEALREFRTVKAAERKVTGSVVLTNPLMETLAESPPPSVEALAAVPYFGEKRVRLYGEELVRLLGAV